ncbi:MULTISPECIES: ABC transporter transmembrane domain-containing protein [unclassified Sphingomonas]|uniref:ABC transporter transmembrane domain-containing protein n=1 Tax=unclassified Sphingomonas TaxID=196159 RepID=UPI000E73BEEF|nr:MULTISPECIES: ABC transporter transmembrane domain-containing protein [unclassified Sphingomonas]RKE53481.1 ATP-binding cassette subfamily B protein [Sphingomonas sp. PP-CC-1A-547]TCM09975.1 ATP-binding cassette subfamily B protein [Sphingomonas sp. PP-CC-3G-468]
MAKPIPEEKTSRRIGDLAMVWRHASQYPRQIAFAGLALMMTSAATIGIPYGFKRVIDRGFGPGAGGSVANSFHYLLMIVVVLALATAVRFYYVSWLGERVVADIRTNVQRHLLRLTPRFFEENRPSEIASRLTSDTALIEQVVGSTVSIALRNTFTGIGGLIYLFAISPKLAGMLMIGIPLIILPIALLGKRVRNYSRTSQDRVADVGSIATETLGAMKVVQAFGQEDREAIRFSDAVSATFAAARARIMLRAVMTAIVIGLVFGSITLVLWEGAIDVAAGRISGGAIAAFVLTGGIVAGAFGALTEVYGDLLRGAGAAGRLSELLREKPEIAAPANPVALPQPPRGALAFEGVQFHYPTRRDVAALNDFSLDVKPGETVAVVGPSGAGKTTLFQLVQRFYDPDAGRVTLDGIDLRDADPAEVRARIAMVPQETIIFGASARDNLRYGDWSATDDQLWAAAEAANAAEFLRKLPEGLDTFLGEGGARLSGGQRQRVTIARALLRDAPILLLDEATSALDAESERLVQEALERLMANRTTLVIAHRLATVRAAERIIVMSDGQIVEEGSHASLMTNSGLYARLASLQFNEAA